MVSHNTVQRNSPRLSLIVVTVFLASQDALEVMRVSHSLIVSTDLTDVTLVSDDTYRRVY